MKHDFLPEEYETLITLRAGVWIGIGFCCHINAGSSYLWFTLPFVDLCITFCKRNKYKWLFRFDNLF